MTENELIIFKTVYESPSVSQAARTLNLAQTYVSKIIRKIEADYQTSFFNRTRNRLNATTEGREFYKICCDMLAQLEKARRLFSQDDSVRSLAILVSPYIAETVIAGTFSEFAELYPQIRPDIRVFSMRFFDQLLEEKPADVVMSATPLNHPDYQEVYRFTEKLSLLVSTDSSLSRRITPDELAVQPLLMRESDSSIRHEIDMLFSKIGCQPNIIAESSSNIFLYQMAAAGQGVAVLPYLLYKLQHSYSNVRLLEPSGFRLSRTLYLYVNNNLREQKHHPVWKYANMIAEYCRESLN